MRMIDRRLILILGLAVAIDVSNSAIVDAAGKTKIKPTRVAQAPGDLNSAPVPNSPAPTPAPAPVPTPLAPTPDPSIGSPSPDPPATSPVVTVPMPLGTKPNVVPPDRPPFGMFYGEQDRLDGLKNPDRRVRPVPSALNSSTANPPVPVAPNANGVVLTPIPDSGAEPGEIDNSRSQPSGVDRWGFAPPPGTLGQTYRRRSRVIEDTKHPRVGAVEVNLPEEVDVTGTGLKTKWTGKVWRLDSEPLLPGIPHIYEIKASWGPGTEPQVRTIRLIMGRIVDLEF